MEITDLEKSAIIAILTDIVLADGIIDNPEAKKFLLSIYNELNITKIISDNAKKIRFSEYIEIINKMNDNKKLYFLLILDKMIENSNMLGEKGIASLKYVLYITKVNKS